MPRISKVAWKRTPSRNRFLIKGIERYGRSAMYHKTGQWAKKIREWKVVRKPTKIFKPLVKAFQKGERKILPKAPRYYPESGLIVPPPSQKKSKRHLYAAKEEAKGQPIEKTKTVRKRKNPLRRSLIPGTILILLSGRFRGKRVVFLKQLDSGLLLITGPYKLNGVPLRRVNQAYVIATTFRLPLMHKLPATLSDRTFKKEKNKKAKKTEADFFAQKAGEKPKKKGQKAKKTIPDSRKQDQKTVDAPLIKSIKKVPLLKHYMASRFSLGRKQFPHLLKF